MPAVVLLAILVVPLVELAVIMQVGDVIGIGWTLVLLVAVSVFGAWLVKREGRRAWTAFRVALAAGRWPGDEVVHGALVLVGSVLLVTPGFVTDVVGFALLLPPTRAVVSRLVRARLTPVPLQAYQTVRGARRQVRRGADPAGRRSGGDRPAREQGGDTYDVEVVSVERDEPPRPDAGDR